MAEHREEIVRRYRPIARLPDGLFFFTFPLRQAAVQRLALPQGGRVVEIGCGSGANFPWLVQAVGSAGEVVGVDISPDMVAAARQRLRKTGWKNVEIIESAAEEVVLDGKFDGMLLFAMHDVLTSPRALDNILPYLKPGGRLAAAGPKTAGTPMGKVLNPIIGFAYKRFAVATQDKDCPWRSARRAYAGVEY